MFPIILVLYVRTINLVIFVVCADKSDEKSSNRKLYYYNKSIIVAPNIENVMLVSYIISIRKIHSYLRKVMPVGIFSYLIPSF